MSFFGLFTAFKQNHTASVRDEFNRLAKQQAWSKSQKERFQAACYEDELALYWVEADIRTPLEKLQSLCQEVGIPIPESVRQCKKALSRVNVNLVDLMDARRKGKRVKTFKTAQARKNYTHNSKKFFPRQAAKTEGVRVLLKHLN